MESIKNEKFQRLGKEEMSELKGGLDWQYIVDAQNGTSHKRHTRLFNKDEYTEWKQYD